MATLWTILGGICGIVAFGGWIVLLIGAFRDEIWKGVACLLCQLYALYYAAFEYNGDYQTPILLAFVGGTVLSILFGYLAGHQ